MGISSYIAVGAVMFAIGSWVGSYSGKQSGFTVGKQYGFDLGHAFGVLHCSQEGDPSCRKWLTDAKRTIDEPEIFSPPFFGAIERL